MTGQCKVDGCARELVSFGMCDKHYRRWRKHGDPDFTIKTPPGVMLQWLDGQKDYVGDGCLTWPFYMHSRGFTQIRIAGKKRNVSNLMCELAHGPAPTPKHQAAHSCGNAHNGCIHPGHLRWATQAENEADKKIHGTVPLGEKHGRAVLTEALVLEIRSLEGRLSWRNLALRFGIGKRTVHQIIKRETWRHI
jgi:hypothetical protein